MSKLDELIAEFCPNGVIYKALNDVIISLNTGLNPRKFFKLNTDDAKNYYITIREMHNGEIIFTDKTDRINDEALRLCNNRSNLEKGDVLFSGTGTIGETAVIDETPTNWNIKEGVYAIKPNQAIIDSRYLSHLLGSEEVRNRYMKKVAGGTVKSLPMAELRKLRFPVPHLEVQREIVRLLDSFTLLTAELTAKLTVELTARKKQYEFYRDKLLSVKENIPIVKLKDIAIDFYRGSGIKREEVTDEGIPCVRYGEIYTTYGMWFDKCVSHTKLEYVQSPKYFEHGDILFAITGESVEDIAKSVAYIGNEKCLAGGDIVVMKHKQNPRYLAHVLSTTGARAQKSKGKVKSKVVHSNVPSIQEIEIPLPSLEIQERYANVLDNFEAICTDLNIGLPAEIDARKKQYEFYRDALLTFAETGSIIDRQTDRQSLIKLLQYVFGFVYLELKEVANTFRGEYITKKDTKSGKVPVILGGQEPAYYVDRYNHDGEIVVVARSGASAGFVSYWDEPIFVTDGFGFEAKTEMIKPRYLYYALKNVERDLNAMKRGAGVPHVGGEMLGKWRLPVPSIPEQNRIVSLLDRFDTLCTDLTTGLPAEIKARQKQYEYYRDKLLSF